MSSDLVNGWFSIPWIDNVTDLMTLIFEDDNFILSWFSDYDFYISSRSEWGAPLPMWWEIWDAKVIFYGDKTTISNDKCDEIYLEPKILLNPTTETFFTDYPNIENIILEEFGTMSTFKWYIEGRWVVKVEDLMVINKDKLSNSNLKFLQKQLYYSYEQSSKIHYLEDWYIVFEK